MNYCTYCGNVFGECECRERARGICQRIFSGVSEQLNSGLKDMLILNQRFPKVQWADFFDEALRERRKKAIVEERQERHAG